MRFDDDDQPVTAETFAANARHDSQKHSVTMDTKVRLRSRNPQIAVMGPLTDKRIAHYERLGYYTQEFKDARKAVIERKRNRANQMRREGNFLLHPDGRKVFAPV